MIKLVLKKSFFDGWDNLFSIFIFNIIFGLIIFGTVWVFILLNKTGHELDVLKVVSILTITLFLLSFHSLGINALTINWSCYKKAGFSQYINGIRKHFTHGLLYFLVHFFIMLCYLLIIPMYLQTKTIIALIISFLIFWTSLIVFLSFQFFYPLLYLMENDKVFKTAKKCVIVFFDNLSLSLFVLIKNILDLIISVFTLTFIPGLAGIILFKTDVMKFIMKRYDYVLENNITDNKISKRNILWNEILFEERKNIESRSFKDIIFPWKQ